jgi:DNA (cytosine-5)-methyltransferase 1
MKKNKIIKAISLFANVGIAETYLSDLNIDVVLANEIDKQRVKFYKHLYPKTKVIEGDITQDDIKKQIIQCAKKNEIDLLLATPPCQGMSTAGKMLKNDSRNLLITHAIDIIRELKPKFVFLENVPEQLKTKINYKNENILILEYIKKELGALYNFNTSYLVNAADYGVPQTRERSIILLSRKDVNYIWDFPAKDNNIVTLEDAIGYLPSLDPELYDLSKDEQDKIFPNYEQKKQAGLKVSKWHYPPKHVYRQVYSLMHTPSGKTAFDNIEELRPKKQDGSFVKGFKNTYKRQSWDKPGYTVTMYNRTIGSQNNVHPGRYIGKDENKYDLYSDARVLTIFELMLVTSLPTNWNIPDWASDHFIRQVIGEGIPPLLVKKIMKEMVLHYE